MVARINKKNDFLKIVVTVYLRVNEKVEKFVRPERKLRSAHLVMNINVVFLGGAWNKK